jgi:hypothetical protein
MVPGACLPAGQDEEEAQHLERHHLHPHRLQALLLRRPDPSHADTALSAGDSSPMDQSWLLPNGGTTSGHHKAGGITLSSQRTHSRTLHLRVRSLGLGAPALALGVIARVIGPDRRRGQCLLEVQE